MEAFTPSETLYNHSSNPTLTVHHGARVPHALMRSIHQSPLLSFAPAPAPFRPVPDLSLAPPASDCPAVFNNGAGRCSAAMARKHSSSAFAEEPGVAEANRVLASASYMEHRSAVSGRYMACIGRCHGRARIREVTAPYKYLRCTRTD